MVFDGVSPKFNELLVVKLFKLAFITLLGTPVRFIPCCSIMENKLAPLEPEIFNYLQTAKPTVNKEIQLTDSLNLMMEHQDFYKHIVQGNHFDIGTPPGLLSASMFASQNPNLVSGQY